METLRFLMISTHFPPEHLGGDAVLVEYLSRELVRRGHEVHVLHNPAVYESIRKIRTRGNRHDMTDGIHRHPCRSPSTRAAILGALVFGAGRIPEGFALDIVKDIHPDVVHWHNTRGFIGRPLRFGNEILLLTAHDYGAVCPKSNLLKPNLQVCETPRMCSICSIRSGKPPHMWRLLSNRLIKYPEDTKVIAPSKFMAKRLAREGVNVSHILYNFVPDQGTYFPDGQYSENSIIYIGLLEPHKGLRTLIKAFSKSALEHDFALDVVGDGFLRNELAAIVARSRMDERIRIHGFLKRDEVDLLRAKATAQVVPSEWYENCPLTVLEAFAAGVPVIGSDKGGIPELAQPESGSRLFKSGDIDSLAKALISAWNDRKDIAALRRKARSTYESRFRPDIHVAEYMRIIKGSN